MLDVPRNRWVPATTAVNNNNVASVYEGAIYSN